MANNTKSSKQLYGHPISFAIAVPCYNEEHNIQELLQLLTTGWTSQYKPKKIVIFSSECSDRTDDIITAFAEISNIPVILLTEQKRSGKCHAINQLMKRLADVDIIILVSADIQISTQNLIKILENFKNKGIGVVAGRPVPISDNAGLVYRVSKVMWDIHHLMALQIPKSTEVTAFRNLGFRLDETSLVDEAEIEMNISKRGLRVKYCPDATIVNKVPQKLIDHIKQRIRVTIGHCVLKREKKYSVGTIRPGVRANALRRYVRSKDIDYFAFAILLAIESYVFLTGSLLALFKRSFDGKWQRIASAKKKFN